MPGEEVTLNVEVTSDQSLTGGPCIDIYRWQPGYGPEVDWHIDLRSGVASEDETERPVCPTDEVDLPTSLSFDLPPLDEEVYRVTYRWSDANGEEGAPASLEFEVGAG
jgi:hypothetical protein